MQEYDSRTRAPLQLDPRVPGMLKDIQGGQIQQETDPRGQFAELMAPLVTQIVHEDASGEGQEFQDYLTAYGQFGAVTAAEFYQGDPATFQPYAEYWIRRYMAQSVHSFWRETDHTRAYSAHVSAIALPETLTAQVDRMRSVRDTIRQGKVDPSIGALATAMGISPTHVGLLQAVEYGSQYSGLGETDIQVGSVAVKYHDVEDVLTSARDIANEPFTPQRIDEVNKSFGASNRRFRLVADPIFLKRNVTQAEQYRREEISSSMVYQAMEQSTKYVERYHDLKNTPVPSQEAAHTADIANPETITQLVLTRRKLLAADIHRVLGEKGVSDAAISRVLRSTGLADDGVYWLQKDIIREDHMNHAAVDSEIQSNLQILRETLQQKNEPEQVYTERQARLENEEVLRQYLTGSVADILMSRLTDPAIALRVSKMRSGQTVESELDDLMVQIDVTLRMRGLVDGRRWKLQECQQLWSESPPLPTQAYTKGRVGTLNEEANDLLVRSPAWEPVRPIYKIYLEKAKK